MEQPKKRLKDTMWCDILCRVCSTYYNDYIVNQENQGRDVIGEVMPMYDRLIKSIFCQIDENEMTRDTWIRTNGKVSGKKILD